MDTTELLREYAIGRINFSNITLHEAQLSKAKLPFVIFSEASFRKANLICRKSGLSASTPIASASLPAMRVAANG
jgi:hypothetical protein